MKTDNTPMEQTPKKKLFLTGSKQEFEDFVNREDVEIIQIYVKSVEQSFMFQEHFAAVSSGGTGTGMALLSKIEQLLSKYPKQ